MTGRDPRWSSPPFEVTVSVSAQGGHFFLGRDPDPGVPVLPPVAIGHLVTPQTSCVAVSCPTDSSVVDVELRSSGRAPATATTGLGCVETSLETGTGWFGLYEHANGDAVDLPTLVRGPGWYRLRICLVADRSVEIDLWPEDGPRPDDVLKSVELPRPSGAYVAMTGVFVGGATSDERPGIRVQRALQLSVDGRLVSDWAPAYTPGGDGIFRDVEGVPIAIFGTDGGTVPVQVKHSLEPPELDAGGWKAVVEISVTTETGRIRLADTRGQAVDVPELAFRGPGTYRIRWHAHGRDQGPPTERHQVVVWPAEPAAGQVHRLDDQLGYQLTYIPEPPPPEPALPVVAMASTASATWARTVRLNVEYRQYQLLVGDGPDLDEPMLSPTNGLVDLRRSHATVICGTHTGPLALHAERHELEPALDESWDEILEFSVYVAEQLGVAELMGGWLDLPLLVETPGVFRVRLHARGRDAAFDAQDVYGLYEHHAILVWPAPLEPVRVIRTSDDFGRIWREQTAHREVELNTTAFFGSRSLRQAEPEVVPEPVDLAALVQAQRVRDHPLRRYAPELVAGLESTGDERQRRVARFAVRRAVLEARLDELPWVPPALDAMDREAPLPAPFDSPQQLFDIFRQESDRPDSGVPSLPHEPHMSGLQVSQQAFALPLPWSVNQPGPAVVLDMLHTALMVYGGDRYGVLLDEIAEAFPDLTRG